MFYYKACPFACSDCTETFAFNSERTQHKIVHKEIKSHFCMAKNCGREFYHASDLTAHAKTHTRKV